MTRFILIAATMFLVVNTFSSTADAQSRRGRLFQRIKEDIFGSTKTTSPSASQAQATTQQKTAAAKQQQLRLQQQQQASNRRNQQPQTGRVPTPVAGQNRAPAITSNRANNSIYRRTQTQPGIARPAPTRPTSSTRSDSDTRGGSNYRSPTKVNFSDSKSYPKPRTRSAKNGFGFQLTLSSKDKLFVTTVERGSNAEEVGLRRGDQVLEIGGIEATSVEEFDEISKVMGQGDELEFKISRSGREKTVNVRFGELPELEDVEEAALSKSNGEKRYDFAPPSEPSQEDSQSVLSRGQNKVGVSTRGDVASRQVRLLNQRISEQSRQIQQLQQEIQRLRGRSR